MLAGLPGDPVILLGVVNTKLRDFYPSLEGLCDDMQIDRTSFQRNWLRSIIHMMRSKTSLYNG